MKSKFTLLVFSFIFSLKLYSQTALPNGMIYYLHAYTIGSGNTSSYGLSDTVHLDSSKAGYNYYSFDRFSNKQVLIHQNRFYIRYNSDSLFKMIYDFNLKAGDYMKGYDYIDSLRIDSVDNEVIGKDSFIIQYVTVTKALSLYPRNFRFVNRIGSLEAGLEYWYHFFFEAGRDLLGICNQNEALRWQIQPYLQFTKRATCNSMDSILHSISVKPVNKNLTVLLYPNPVSNQLEIETLHPNEVLTIEIYNSLGSLIYQTKCIDTIHTIDLSNFENGLYIVKMTTSDNQISIQKIIKQ